MLKNNTLVLNCVFEYEDNTELKTVHLARFNNKLFIKTNYIHDSLINKGSRHIRDGYTVESGNLSAMSCITGGFNHSKEHGYALRFGRVNKEVSCYVKDEVHANEVVYGFRDSIETWLFLNAKVPGDEIEIEAYEIDNRYEYYFFMGFK